MRVCVRSGGNHPHNVVMRVHQPNGKRLLLTLNPEKHTVGDLRDRIYKWPTNRTQLPADGFKKEDTCLKLANGDVLFNDTDHMCVRLCPRARTHARTVARLV